MPTYNVHFYSDNPNNILTNTVGNTFVWTGQANRNGTATITDNEAGVQGTTLDDDNNGNETATANVTVNGQTSTNSNVDNEATWTVRDTVTGLEFQIIHFDVEDGNAAGDYTLSEVPLVAGRTYEVLDYDSNPDVLAGDPVFSSEDYTNLEVEGTFGDDTIDGSYADDPEGDVADGGDGTGVGGNQDTIFAGAGDDSVSSGLEDDLVYGGSGDDTLLGGSGNDTLRGDSDPQESGRIGATNTVGSTFTVIRLGSAADVDPTETNDLAEDADDLTGTYGGPGAELYWNILDAETFDTDGSGAVNDNDNGATPENIVIDGTTYQIDSGIVYNATVTFTDGSSGGFTAVVIQTTTGDVFMMPELSANADNTLLTSRPIESISLDTVDNAAALIGANRLDADWTVGPGAPGNDSIDGGAGNDEIYGEAGNDTLEGGAGNDLIEGGDGDDLITDSGTTGGDSDTIYGGDGNDTIDAGDRSDTVFGGDGDDVITDTGGAFSDDVLYGEAGNDTISGGTREDLIVGGADDDVIEGGDGDDTIYGDDAPEAGQWDYQVYNFDFLANPDQAFDIESGTLVGSGQTGTFESGTIANDARGTAGDPNDFGIIYTSRFLASEDGTYTFSTTSDDGSTVRILDENGDPLTFTNQGGGTDTFMDNDFHQGATTRSGEVDLEAGRLYTIEVRHWENAGQEVISGQVTSPGGTTEDLANSSMVIGPVAGATGDDSLDGGTGNDAIFGDGGNDTLTGGTGADSLYGGLGDDEMYLAEGDSAYGGDGDDLFVLGDLGEIGASTITIVGGEGDETNGDTLQLTPDVTFDDITFTNTDDLNGGLSGNFALNDGTVVTFSEIENIICFTPGTRILTVQGERKIEDLRPGDLVITRDSGPQPIRWIGHRTVVGRDKFAPIAINSTVMDGARRPLLVSPQHRILFTGYKAQLLFGESEVLVAAKHLVDGRDVRVLEREKVTYFHMMLDRHEVVYAEGAATESFHAGDVGLGALSDQSREEMFGVFPELRSNVGSYGPTARPCLKKHEARLLTSVQPEMAFAA